MHFRTIGKTILEKNKKIKGKKNYAENSLVFVCNGSSYNSGRNRGEKFPHVNIVKEESYSLQMLEKVVHEIPKYQKLGHDEIIYKEKG